MKKQTTNVVWKWAPKELKRHLWLDKSPEQQSWNLEQSFFLYVAFRYTLSHHMRKRTSSRKHAYSNI